MRLAILTAGLGFGDEGKGATVDTIVRQTGATLCVRYNGGAQCGHTVVTPTRRTHRFAQFGAGTLAGASTYLGPRVMVDPPALRVEARALAGLFDQALAAVTARLTPDAVPRRMDPDGFLTSVTLDPEAPVLTPGHRAANRLRELARGSQRHGSCGMGIGELGADLAYGQEVLRVKDLASADGATSIAARIRERKLDELHADGVLTDPKAAVDLFGVHVGTWAAEAAAVVALCRVGGMPDAEVAVFEGAQGVLLDEWRGFHPYTTWSDCTFRYAEELLLSLNGGYDEIPRVVKVGVLRAFATRHGAGPLPTEMENGSAYLRGEHNARGDWQGAFRVGHFDAVLARYALLALGSVDLLTLTCLDRVDRPRWRAAVRYQNHPRLTSGGMTIPLGPERDLGYQQLLTTLLDGIAPVYAEPTGALGDWIEAALGVPVGLVGRGPTAADYSTRPTLEEKVPCASTNTA